MALSVEILRTLATPATVDELARRLEVPQAYLQRELERLERRGYVRRLACGPSVRPTAPGVRTASPAGCGWCALKATCDATVAERAHGFAERAHGVAERAHGFAVRWLRA